MKASNGLDFQGKIDEIRLLNVTVENLNICIPEFARSDLMGYPIPDRSSWYK